MRLGAILLLLLPAAAVAAGKNYDLQFERAVILVGEERGGQTGNSIVAGDFDGDGIDDLAVSSPGRNREDPERSLAGRVDVFFGGPGRTPDREDLTFDQSDWVILGAEERDGIGYHLKAGDLDGDGRDDLVITAIYLDGPGGDRVDCGGAFVFFGAPRDAERRVVDLARESADLTIHGAETKDYFGGEAAVGDLDGDGRDDLILGAFYGDGPKNERHHCGEAHILFGRPRAEFPAAVDLANTKLPWIYGAEASDTFGRALAVGDLNGDGLGDLIGGAYYADGPENERINAGEVFVLYGRPRDLFPAETDLADGADLLLFGEAEGFVAGRDVAAADMNRDGIDDLLISAHSGLADPETAPAGQVGILYIVYGRSGGGRRGVIDLRTDADCRIQGMDRSDQMSWPLFTGVIDGEGNRGVAAAAKKSFGGAVDRHEAGEVYLIPSRPRTESLRGRIPVAEAASLSLIGRDERDNLAFDGAILDWNGDGRPEIAIGVPLAKGSMNDKPSAGEAIIFFVPE